MTPSFSLSSSILPTNTTTSPSPPLFSKSTSSGSRRRRFKVSCSNAAANNPNNNNNDNVVRKISSIETPKKKLILPNNVDRRDLLLGLGGLYGASNVQLAFASPLTTPDNPASKCIDATFKGLSKENAPLRGVSCCPPSLAGKTTAKPYHLPTFHKKVRVRPAAHKVTPDYIKNYQEAIRRMKALDDNHPWSWKQQAKIHCAYCDEAYTDQISGKQIKVHYSWLFFPFHRWYLYFYERILGKLIGDENFALPYWNWDSPIGMTMPPMFEAPFGESKPKANPIFDPYRNATHIPPAVVDLQYSGKESGLDCINQVSVNLSTMYRQMVSGACDADRFFGTDHNDEEPKGGTVENGCHTAMHIWVGNPRNPYNEDMGNFYSAGYDPLFYVHHTNVDRLWHVWKGLDRKKHREPISDDWKKSSYVFYDENENLVRVCNEDCVNIKDLGYDYQRSGLTWLQSRPPPCPKRYNRNQSGVVGVEKTKFPVKLKDVVKVLVKRPPKEDKEKDETEYYEILSLSGIEFNCDEFFKFDVLVNDADDGIEKNAADCEFAGSFSQIPHFNGDKEGMSSQKTGVEFEITELLEDIDAKDDDSVLVTLVRRAGTKKITIGDIKIKRVTVK